MPLYGWVIIFIHVGVSRGLIHMSLNFAIQAMAEERNVAYSVSMYAFFRSLEMDIGVAISGAVSQIMQLHLSATERFTRCRGLRCGFEDAADASAVYRGYA